MDEAHRINMTCATTAATSTNSISRNGLPWIWRSVCRPAGGLSDGENDEYDYGPEESSPDAGVARVEDSRSHLPVHTEIRLKRCLAAKGQPGGEESLKPARFRRINRMISSTTDPAAGRSFPADRSPLSDAAGTAAHWR